ncbi:hypothetical protein C8F04DRAFT_881254, partial [Mycena alexandri]
LVGTGPGPSGPTVGRLNPFLRLIVRDLGEFFTGVYFTRTNKYPEGRHTKAMLILLIADMIAARETAGFSSSTSKYFCISCHLDYSHIEDFNPAVWPQRSDADHLKHAHAWKNASTVAEQGRIADTTGVRYSALLELPYWRPSSSTPTEPMHADSNIESNHVRDLFVIDLSVDGGDGSEPRVERPTRPTNHWMLLLLTKFWTYRQEPDILPILLKEELATFEALWHICNDRHLRIAGNPNRRDWFILRIQNWVSLFHLILELSAQINAQIKDNNISEVVVKTIPPPAITPGEALAKLVVAALDKLSSSAEEVELDEVELSRCSKLLRSLYRGTKFTSLKVKKGEKSVLPAADLVNRGPVVGRDVMGAIWADMRRTILPSWVAAAPKNWGTAKRGKLSAAHWKAVWTIHLPVTLIWLWRNETSRKRELLNNMLEGVMAVLCAAFKSTDINTSQMFDYHFREYMTGVARLFRENTIIPSQHIAFHIGQHMRESGPEHSKGAQFYERYIHHLQKQNTNGKFGEMESTFMQASARTANLKALLSDN